VWNLNQTQTQKCVAFWLDNVEDMEVVDNFTNLYMRGMMFSSNRRIPLPETRIVFLLYMINRSIHHTFKTFKILFYGILCEIYLYGWIIISNLFSCSNICYASNVSESGCVCNNMKIIRFCLRIFLHVDLDTSYDLMVTSIYHNIDTNISWSRYDIWTYHILYTNASQE
jgi:hypothetical protein